MQEFNNRLKTAMNIKSVTQSELCEKTGIPKSAMSQYLSGNFKPKQNRTHSLAKALDVNEAWLMGYDVPMERQVKENDSINTNTNKNIMSENLKKIRRDKGLDFSILSIRSGISKDDLKAYERGFKRFTSSDIKSLEEAFGVEKGTLKGKKPYIPTGPEEPVPTAPHEVIVVNDDGTYRRIMLTPEQAKKLLGLKEEKITEKYINMKNETTDLLKTVIELISENRLSYNKLVELNEEVKLITELDY